MGTALVCGALLCGALSGGCKESVSSSEDGGLDLFGLDLHGTLSCRQLNDCERICRDVVCVEACRARANPNALAKQIAAQACFDQRCPQIVDGGTGVCALDAQGQFPTACHTCISNTQVGPSGTCSPPEAPECHACVEVANVCKLDY